MTKNIMRTVLFALAVTGGSAALAEQFVVELAKPLTGDDSALRQKLEVTEVESFDATGKSYVVFDVKDEGVLEDFFATKSIEPLKVTAVGFVNSPEIGGGLKAGADPLPGHQTYVIERPVPGIGDLPPETQKQLSMGSNAALTEIGGGIEWVHSYLTDEGTYCVYRAVDTDKIVEHGKISKFPIDTIRAVVQTKTAGE